MTERPILFSGAMVRALLAGRKTQTRRLIKPQPEAPYVDLHPEGLTVFQGRTRATWANTTDGTQPGMFSVTCPYGQPGDQLWVRETHTLGDSGLDRVDVHYRSTGTKARCHVTPEQAEWAATWVERMEEGGDGGANWRPSILMPHFASRIQLEVTEVRAERLTDITREDAIAEGAEARTLTGAFGYRGDCWCMDWEDQPEVSTAHGHASPQFAFLNYVERLHGGPRWNLKPTPSLHDLNPWMWAVSFRVLATEPTRNAPEPDA